MAGINTAIRIATLNVDRLNTYYRQKFAFGWA
jgi:hypothetical protein